MGRARSGMERPARAMAAPVAGEAQAAQASVFGRQSHGRCQLFSLTAPANGIVMGAALRYA